MTDIRRQTAWHRLSQSTLSVAVIRQVDQTAITEFHMHSLVLMENAASACARWLVAQRGDRPRVVILCGRGNNGGDGLALWRHLQLADWPCQAFVLGPLERLSADARANWQIVKVAGDHQVRMVNADGFLDHATTPERHSDSMADSSASLSIREAILQADIIVDAMLGSGASGRPREPFASWIEWSNAASAATRIAIDIPTGLDAETGEVAPGCFRADATLSFVARKPGFHAQAAKAVLGHVEVLSIGIPQALVQRLLDQSLSSGPCGGS